MKGTASRLSSAPSSGASFPNSQARLAGLQDGTLQMVALVEGKDVVQAQSFGGIEVIQTKPYVLYENFNINTKRAPFDDKRVRQALAYAFDRKSYTKTIWFGFARPTINPVPPEMATYLPNSAGQYPFDLDKAAALLAEAGFTKDKPLKMEILTPAGFNSLKSMALLLQDNLNRIGHNVTIGELEVTVWIDRILTKPDYDLTTNNYNTGPEDPASMFNSPNLAPAANVSLWNPPGYADLVAKAAAEIDPTKQVELYQELQKLLLEEMPQLDCRSSAAVLPRQRGRQGAGYRPERHRRLPADRALSPRPLEIGSCGGPLGRRSLIGNGWPSTFSDACSAG